MTGEWEEKKGQKQTDRWSGKVMQLKGWNSTDLSIRRTLTKEYYHNGAANV